MLSHSLLLLALCKCSAAGQADLQCADTKQQGTDCASKTRYKTVSGHSENECCAECDSDSKCKQWTYHSFLGLWGTCYLSSESEAPSKEIFSNCGIKASPPSPPAPPSPPSPPTPPSPSRASDWAVIAVGSRGYVNYRHQADACHAYQIMLKSGISPDHIILMMQDDVAGNLIENPFPGKLFNKQGSDVNVYAGCKVDYRGSVVTADLFAKVVTGDESAGGKVLKSGTNSRVFINFVDHGGVGMVAFPNGPPMYAGDLSRTLKTMQKKKLFNELVFYMEACESGSMFPDLARDSKIFAVTAANARESSWGYYCFPMDTASGGKHLKTCLGDLFSISWMEDSDLGALSSESLATQVRRVTQRVTKSHVQTFGDKSFNNEVIGHFEFGSSSGLADPVPADVGEKGAISTRDIHLWYYQNLVDTAENETEKKAAQKDLEQAIADRKADWTVFNNIAHKACEGAAWDCANGVLNIKQDLTNYACHKALVKIVHDSCPTRGPHAAGGWNSYNMHFSQALANACQLPEGIKQGSLWTKALSKIVLEECTSPTVPGAEVVV